MVSVSFLWVSICLIVIDCKNIFDAPWLKTADI